jgi:prepilin-type N-terminal cleavage/methylation domain-containing protein
VKAQVARYGRSQAGFTLVEVVITAAIGAVLMSALTSVILTSFNAGKIATSRVEASGEMRNFQFYAHDDFAHAIMPAPVGCGTTANPCTTQPIVLDGTQVSNSVSPVPASFQVSYTWDGSGILDRQIGGGPVTHMGTDVSNFAWYLDGTAPNQTVVVSVTVTVGAYSETQVFRFDPQVNP